MLASVIQAMFLWRLVPSLAIIHTLFGMALSAPLRFYIGLSNNAVIVAPILLLLWGGLRLSGRRVPAKVRGVLLVVAAAAAVAATLFGLYFMAVDGLVQAMRLSLGAPASVVERDVVSLYLASGNPAAVIAMLDPKGNRDDFATSVTWRSPNQAFQLAEAYRAQQRRGGTPVVPARPGGRRQVRRRTGRAAA